MNAAGERGMGDARRGQGVGVGGDGCIHREEGESYKSWEMTLGSGVGVIKSKRTAAL